MGSEITARITSEPNSIVRSDPAPAASPPASEPTLRSDTSEGVAIVWNQLTRTDIERVKRELDQRRSEMLARHSEELKALEGDQAEINILGAGNR
jgi:hypothetical protein